MLMKSNELTEAALDWAVANCEGLLAFGWKNDTGILRITLSTGECIRYIPSDDWSQGGPIIEREGLTLDQYADFPKWQACMWWDDENSSGNVEMYGATILIAAMRCYVAAKLGDEVETPEELT